MILATFEQQPGETLDYDVDYAPWLESMGDVLQRVSVARLECLTDAADTGLRVSGLQMSATRARLWVSGGVHRARYKLTLRAQTAGGRVDESELVFKIREH